MPPASAAVTNPGLAGLFTADGAAKLDSVLSGPGCTWVTDADGTLWTDDIGEGFLKQLILDKAFVSPEAGGDVWASYEARVKADRTAGYAWAAQVMAGMREEDVVARADAYAKTFVPKHLFPGMSALLAEARARGCDRWIVSASNVWIVRAAAPYLGIDPRQARGIEVVVKGGVLTTELMPPVPYREGKVETIRKFVGRMPTLVSGDSVGDREMLAAATGAALVIHHPGHTDPAFAADVRAAGWLLEPLAAQP
jgi:HAD superfamily phosphoserine phosphatase-like hydrolase